MIQETIKKIKIFIIPLLLSAVIIFVPSAQAASGTGRTLTNGMIASIRALYTGSYTMPWYEENLSDAITMKEIYTYEAEYTYIVSGFAINQYNSGYAISYGTFSYSAPQYFTVNGINVNISNESGFIQYYYGQAMSASSYNYTSTTIFDNATGFTGYDAGHFTIKVEITRTPNNAQGSYTAPPDYITINITDRGTNGNNITYDTEPNHIGDYSIIYEALENIFTFDTNGRLIVTDPQAESSLGAIWNLLNNHLISGIEIPLQQIDDIYWVLNSVYLQLGYSGVGASNLQYDITRLRLLLNDIIGHLELNGTEEASQAAEMESNAAAVESKMDAVNNYTLPNVNYMLDQADIIWVSGASGQNLLATITNKPYYVMILLGVVSLGFVGYLLYGKGV